MFITHTYGVHLSVLDVSRCIIVSFRIDEFLRSIAEDLSPKLDSIGPLGD